MAEQNQKPFRIVWAVDPLGEEWNFQLAGAKFFQKLAEQASIEVYPIFLYGSYPLEYRLYSPPVLDQASREKAQSSLDVIRKECPIREMKDLEILVAGYTNLKEGVVNLIDRATALNADAIFATTHARKGVTRWIIGSFAEALMEKSTVPLLISNPESKVEWSPSSALFATDLSDESRCAFRQFLPLAAALRSKVTIYHQGVHALSEGFVPAFAGAPIVTSGADQKNRWSDAIAKVWQGSAKSAGVEADVCIDPTLARSPAEGALEKAESLGSWIAIAAQSKPTPISLLGSNARHILRDARVPVWLYRAHT